VKEVVVTAPAPEPVVEIKTVTQKVYIDNTSKGQEKELIMGGTNFDERMAMFQHMAKTKGGKPQVLSQSKAYGLISKLATRRNLLPPSASHEAQKSGDKVTKALDDITSNMNNVHVKASTVHASSNSKQMTLKITKCTAHFLKPRLYGYMNIILSNFIPRWKQTQQPRYFFVLDGLPSETNTNQNEPDFAKNRKHDHLVPTLCFFESKEKYDEFHLQVKEVPTRSVKFQRLFASYAKGTYPLSLYALDVSVEACERRINVLANTRGKKMPKSEIQKLGDVGDTDLLCCNDSEIHKFSCNDQVTRDKWVKKVNRLVDKRAKRLAEINSGLFGVESGHQPEKHQHSVYDEEVTTEIENTMRPTIVGNGPAVTGAKLADVNAVESTFD